MAQLLTPEELAEQHQISVKSIYRLVAQGKLRAVRLPGSRLLRFDPEHLEYTAEDKQQRAEQERQRQRATAAFVADKMAQADRRRTSLQKGRAK